MWTLLNLILKYCIQLFIAFTKQKLWKIAENYLLIEEVLESETFSLLSLKRLLY